jgi:hypothetical protein
VLSDILRLNGRRMAAQVAIVAGDREVTFGELRDNA